MQESGKCARKKQKVYPPREKRTAICAKAAAAAELEILLSLLWQTQLNLTQLLSRASKQHVVCAQQRDVTTLMMTSLHCRPQSQQLS